MIRLLLADDQTLLRQGLRIILSSEPDLEVVGEAVDGEEAITLARELRPDVLLMDVRMPRLDGVEAAAALAGEPGLRVILLTTYDDDDLVLRGMRAGAAGYLLKDQPAEEIIEAIRAVAAGQALFKTSGAARALATLASGPTPGPPRPAAPTVGGLTERETQVLQLIGQGLSDRDIAEALVISEATVKTHINHIFSKLEIEDRGQAVGYAFRSGLVKP
ncbi:MAG: response regulator [Chloroflexota bacterium]